MMAELRCDNCDKLTDKLYPVSWACYECIDKGDEFKANATLGSLVKALPWGWSLSWDGPQNAVVWYVSDAHDTTVGMGDTPEEAITAALKEEGENEAI